MSGICGMWWLDGRPLDPAELARIAKPTAHRGLDGQWEWHSSDIGLVAQHTKLSSLEESQPAVSDAAVVVFDGRLDNREDLLATLDERERLASGSDATIVLACYRQFGVTVFRRLLGDFAFAIYDRTSDVLHLVRDAIGPLPLYYTRSDVAMAFSSEIKGVLQCPGLRREPCRDAIADYLLPGDFQERELTCFESVKRVVPGTTVTASRSAVRISQHDVFDPEKQIKRKTAGDYAEELGHHFQNAVNRRLRSNYPVSVSVSGGVDSSAIICVADRLAARSEGRSVVGVSLVYPDHPTANEEALLDQITLDHNPPIMRIPVREFRFFPESQDYIRQAETPQLQWANVMRVVETARETGSRVMLTGFLGDQALCTNAYFVDLARRMHWRTVSRHIAQHQAWFTDADPKWFGKQLRQRLARSLAPPLVLDAVRRWRASSDAYPLWFSKAFRQRALHRALHQRDSRASAASEQAALLHHYVTSSWNVARFEEDNKLFAARGMQNAYPFGDRDLWSFVMSVPGEIMNLDGVPKGLFREAMKSVLPEPIRTRRWKADFSILLRSGILRSIPYLESLLGGDSLAVDFGFLDRKELSRGLADARREIQDKDSTTLAWRVLLLAGLEVWLRTFFGDVDDSAIAASSRTVAYNTPKS